MYTGIVQNVAKLVDLSSNGFLATLTLSFPENLIDGLYLGASVSVDGICLSVVSIVGSDISFNAMSETINNTTIGKIHIGDTVNIERSMKFGDEIGGHIISGHIDGVSRIVRIDTNNDNHVVTFEIKDEWSDFIVHKGFIGVNGASLTVYRKDEEPFFSVYFIPDTLKRTTFSNKKTGDFVNIEIDNQTKVIVNTVKNYMKSKS